MQTTENGVTSAKNLLSTARDGQAAINRRLLCFIAVSASVVRFAMPMPDGLDTRDWSLLIVFFALLASLAFQSAPMSVIFIGALTMASATGWNDHARAGARRIFQ